MNEFEKAVLGYFTPEQAQKIQSTKVFIAGCGGLGSNVAHMLVRCGFKNFALLDFDILEMKNLNRQFYFPDQVGSPKNEELAKTLLRLNPDLNLELISRKLQSHEEVKDLVQGFDILVEAFDNPKSKSVFVNGAVPLGKPVIAVSGIAGFKDPDSIVTKKIGDNLYLIGDGVSDIKEVPPLSPRVNVAAAKQAGKVLELTLENS